MEVIRKALTLTREQYFITHLNIINPMLPKQLTPKEAEVLGTFMGLEGDTVEYDRFGTSSRKVVKSRLNISDGGLGNYIKSLKEKGFIIVNSKGNMEIPKVLFASFPVQGYMFKIESNESK